jgi:CRISPR/Cas system-associated exonuclease Cas4 (RecB family)
MIITYLRSSSYGTHSMCEQQYFIEYNLGIRSPSNQKADKGTIVHKVMEILADISVAIKKTQMHIEDDICGEIDVLNYDLNSIIETVYEYYTSRFNHHNWKPLDLKHCKQWVEKAINVQNGNFDPRNQNIIQPEQRFDIEIKKPWAYYHYSEDLKGYLAIKGTIDLIAKPNENTLEIIDYKTGRRLDWTTGEEKTFGKLEKDPQLRMYHYAASILYPEIDHIIVSIYFINDGGIFSMNYDRSHLQETEDMIRRKFEEIKRCKRPRLNKSWKCTKLCHFGKNYFDEPLIEYRDNQVCAHGTPMTMCQQIAHAIEVAGINSTIDKYTVEGYNVGKYKAPGSTE